MDQRTPDDQEPGAGSAVSQFLTFTLDGEEYGVDILKVQAIKGWSPITPLPNTPSYIRGVINLRGTIIPVVDLRARFFLADAEPSRFTVIIVVIVDGKATGLMVDAVSDVLDVARADVQAPPEIDGAAPGFVKGVVLVGGKLIAVLDVERILGADVPAALATAS